MYGNAQKCKSQLESDISFLEACDQDYPSRDSASVAYVDIAWQYFYQEDYDTAMKRFNQAWLLDSTNASVYWGVGVLMGMKKEYEESIVYLDKSLKLNPNQEQVWHNLVSSYNNLYMQTNDKAYISKIIERLEYAVLVNPDSLHLSEALKNAKEMLEYIDTQG